MVHSTSNLALILGNSLTFLTCLFLDFTSSDLFHYIHWPTPMTTPTQNCLLSKILTWDILITHHNFSFFNFSHVMSSTSVFWRYPFSSSIFFDGSPPHFPFSLSSNWSSTAIDLVPLLWTQEHNLFSKTSRWPEFRISDYITNSYCANYFFYGCNDIIGKSKPRMEGLLFSWWCEGVVCSIRKSCQ